MRLFVALPIPEDVRQHLAMLCSGLSEVRWVPPENFHISLRFLGEVDGGVMQDVDAGLAGIRAPGFRLQLAGVGHFGSGGKVRTLWAGVEREPALQHLHDKVESAVVRAGLGPEGQKFTPHVTLARVKGRVPKLPEFLARNNLFRSEPFDVTHFTLYSSFLGHGAAIYEAERNYPLSLA